MTFRLLITILTFLTFTVKTFGQTKEGQVIINSVEKKGYYYFPKDALNDSVLGILCKDSRLKYVAPNNRPISFQWNSICNDGDYYLTVTPQQVYFSSGHNNPNPNFLFWFIPIDSSQYLQIKKGLLKKTPKGFSSTPKYYKQTQLFYFDKQFVDTFKIPDEWTDSIQQNLSIHCKAQINQQLKRYFEIINSFIILENDKIKPLTDEEISKIKPKYLSSMKQEIIDWAPHKRANSKVVDE
jgi:hypothetical protein